MDVDALLARRPHVAVVDELAHTNPAGSRNAHRWQDVQELLAAGIDVISTVNIEQLLDVLPAVRVARPRGVRVRELIDHRHVGTTGQQRIDVHLLRSGPAVSPPSGEDLQSAGLRGDFLTAVGLHEAEHHVGPAGTPAPSLVEHRVRLADARRVPDVDPQPTALHAARLALLTRS